MLSISRLHNDVSGQDIYIYQEKTSLAYGTVMRIIEQVWVSANHENPEQTKYSANSFGDAFISLGKEFCETVGSSHFISGRGSWKRRALSPIPFPSSFKWTGFTSEKVINESNLRNGFFLLLPGKCDSLTKSRKQHCKSKQIWYVPGKSMHLPCDRLELLYYLPFWDVFVIDPSPKWRPKIQMS